MDNLKKSTYLFSIDALRVLAILGVIMIHQTTTTLQVLNHNVLLSPFSLFLNQSSRFAVPLFFLISGFVLELNNKTGFSYTTFFKKRASRILIPYLFWSAVYFWIWHGFFFSKILSYNFLTKLLNGTSAYHLYFIPTLIIFYLLFPFFHRFIDMIKNPVFLSIVFVLQIVIAFYNYYFKTIPLQEDLRVALLTISMFLIGMAASHHKDILMNFSKKYQKPLLLMVLSFMVLIFHEVKTLTLTLKTTSFIYNQYGPLNYIYTVILSLLLFYSFEKFSNIRSFVINLSRLSFFVFFIHVFILQNIWSVVIKNLIEKNGKVFLTNIWFDPMIFLIVCAISFFIAFIIHKIPYVSKITG